MGRFSQGSKNNVPREFWYQYQRWNGKRKYRGCDSRRCIDENIMNPNYGIRPELENWSRAKDEIEIKVNLILMSGLVIYITILFWFTKHKQSRSNKAMRGETKLMVKHFKKFLLALIFGSLTTVFSKLPKVRVLQCAYV